MPVAFPMRVSYDYTHNWKKEYQNQLIIYNNNFNYLLKPLFHAKKNEKLVVQTQTGSVFINLHEIVYFKGEGNYTEINLENGKKILISNLLCELERAMAKTTLLFFRIHKSFLINIDYVIEYRCCREKRVVFPGQVEIPIAHRKAKEFCKLMKIHFLHLS